MTLRAVQAWVARETPRPSLRLHCREAATHPPPGPDVVTVRLTGCARELAHHELVELVALGAHSVQIDLGGCASRSAARAHLAPLMTQVQALGITVITLHDPDGAAAKPPAQGAERGREVDAAHPPRSRRQVLMLDTPAELPSESAPDHERLRDGLLAVAAAQGALLETDSLALVLTAPGCDTCGVCVRSCPLDALAITETPAGADLSITTLSHRPAQCDGCRRCIEMCPPQVLISGGRHSWQLVDEDVDVPVHTVPTRRCQRCRARMPAATAGRRCEPCEQRRRNPFVATWPPRVTR